MPWLVNVPVLAAIPSQTIIFVFGGAILVFVFVLTLKAIGKDDADRKFLFSVIALLLGLFGGGGIGALVGGQSADSAATSAANSVKSQVSTVATAAAEGAANKAVTDAVKSVQSQSSK
jgi:hypothetical protein